SGSGVSWSGAWDATWKGAAAGAIGGAAGSVAGNYMAQGYAQMVGGFAGGASGSALNGGKGWDVLQGGLMGAGMSFVESLLSVSLGDDVVDEVSDKEKKQDAATKKRISEADAVRSERNATPREKDAFNKFIAIDNQHLDEAEVEVLFDKNNNVVDIAFASESPTSEGAVASTELHFKGRWYKHWHSDCIQIHSHPSSSKPSPHDLDNMTKSDSFFIYSRKESAFIQYKKGYSSSVSLTKVTGW
ncbi:MAG: hypothetical protein HUJ59_05605, partial [Bacilli bacterium]|nr:hypothetical protein [Bacilli bacterium]